MREFAKGKGNISHRNLQLEIICIKKGGLTSWIGLGFSQQLSTIFPSVVLPGGKAEFCTSMAQGYYLEVVKKNTR